MREKNNVKRRSIAITFVILILAVTFVMLTACDSDSKVGLSAYEIAVKNGFNGTEEEWLASLKGTDGKDGKNGTDGFNGINGEDGKDGQNVLSSLKDIYDQAVASGEFSGTYLEFLSKYFASQSSASIEAAVNEAMRSAVSVYSNFEYTSTIMGITSTKKGTSAGSGIIYKLDKANGDAIIITNYHVVYYATATTDDHISDDISVFLYGKEMSDYKIKAKYVGGSLNYDIAVLKVENSDVIKNSDVTSVNVGSESQSIGTTAIAVGNPASGGLSATSGIISVDSETISLVGADEKTTVSLRVMRIDTAVNSGNSGGGLFNVKGEFIGIVNAKISSSSIENIGYAIPSSVATAVADNLLDASEQGKKLVQKCMLGVTVQTVESSAVYNSSDKTYKIVEKIKVQSVTDGGLASAAGLVAEDVLSEIEIIDKNGASNVVAIDRLFKITDALLTARVGDTVKIKYTRGGVEGVASVVLTDASITEIA